MEPQVIDLETNEDITDQVITPVRKKRRLTKAEMMLQLAKIRKIKNKKKGKKRKKR